MRLPPLIKQVNDAFAGQPDTLLTVALIVVAAVLVLIALFAAPIVKAAALAWALMP